MSLNDAGNAALEAPIEKKSERKITESPEDRAARVAHEREELLTSVAAFQADTLQRRVAWILNYYPETRDSDIALQLNYWRHFDEIDADDGVSAQNLYKGTRLTSLARARAKVQNTYQLFQASPAIRKRRGQLSDEEREKHIEDVPRNPGLVVYADESGKEAPTLVVGSLWFLLPIDTVRFMAAIDQWKDANGFEGEFHFSEINKLSVDTYIEFGHFLADQSAMVTFRAVTAANTGHKHVDPVLETMTYHLLARGVEHEHQSGRAPLPRHLIFYKDDSEAGRDQVTLSELRDRLINTAAARFNNQLTLGDFFAVSSKSLSIVQCADLFAGAVSRRINFHGQNSPKDRFAQEFLAALGMPSGATHQETVDGMAVTLAL